MKLPATLATFAALLIAGAANAGIYNTTDDDNDIRLTANVAQFRGTLAGIRSIGLDTVDVSKPVRNRYRLLEALGGAKPPATLTLAQKLDYSAVLIRRKKFQQAIDFLTPLVRQHPEIFLFDSHLAMAYWGSGQKGFDRRAVDILTQVLSKRGWPENFADLSEEQREFFLKTMFWSEGQYEFYRKAETYLLKLMRQRLAEGTDPPKTVDALFDDGKKPASPIRYVGDDGTFTPGKIAAAEKKKLPPDALEIVEQLALWLPEDMRLYWQLGEVANAQGAPENVAAAGEIFVELTDLFDYRPGDLRQRRLVLGNHVQSMAPEPANFDDIDKRVTEIEQKKGALPMDRRTLVITFATGLAVGIFAVWQFQEIRRRRRGA